MDKVDKKCSKCGIIKPIAEFHRNGLTKSGAISYRGPCRDCEGKSNYRRPKPEDRLGKRKCASCGFWKSRTEEYFEVARVGLRAKCRECRHEEHNTKRKQFAIENPVMAKCKELASNARSRVLDPSRGYKLTYRNLENPFGFNGIVEMAQFLYVNFYDKIKELLDAGLVPSVDRIDEKTGYTRDNIQILEFRDNMLKRWHKL